MNRAITMLLGMVAMLGLGVGGGVTQTEKSGPGKKDAPMAVDRYGDPLPDGAMARLGTMRYRYGPGSQRIAFAPSGNILASTGVHSTEMVLWNADTGQIVRRCDVPRFSTSLTFSPDGKKLLVGRTLFEVATGNEIRTFTTPPANFDSAYSPDGNTVASATIEPGAKQSIVLWDANTGKELRRLQGHGHNVTSLTFSPKESTILASAGFDKTVRVWNAQTGKQLYQVDAHGQHPRSVVIAPNGRFLAAGFEDGVIRLWEVSTGKPLREVKTDSTVVYGVVFSPDSTLMSAVCSGTTISLWNPETGKEVRRWETQANHVSSVSFAPDGKTIAVFTGSALRRWSTETGKEINPTDGHHGDILALRVASNGNTLFSCGADRKVLAWDLASGKEKHGPATGLLGVSQKEFWTIANLSPDGKVLAQVSLAASDSKQGPVIYLWHTVSGKEIHALRGHKGRISSVVFSTDAKYLASSGEDGIRLWNAASGRELHHINGKVDTKQVRFSTDGKSLVSAGSDRRIYQWNVATGNEIRHWESVAEETDLLVFSPDDRLIAASDREAVRIWVADTGKELMRQAGPFRPVSLGFSPTGRMLVAVGGGSIVSTDDRFSGMIHVWEVCTGNEIRRMRTPPGNPKSLAFTPDNRTLACGGADSTILLWDLTGYGITSPAAPSAAELDKLWTDLAGDASKADRAHWTLALSPQPSVPFLKERLRPATPADAKQVAKLLTDLDSKTIDVRRKAERTFIDLGESAEAALRNSMESNPPLEVRRRVEQILERREPDVLRQLRAIDTLEQIGTPQTRGVIEALAKATPNPRVAQAAEGALRRLARQKY